MSASDPLIEASVAGLDLVPIEMAITAAGTAIDTPPIAGVIQSQSVILYRKRHSNIERANSTCSLRVRQRCNSCDIDGLAFSSSRFGNPVWCHHTDRVRSLHSGDQNCRTDGNGAKQAAIRWRIASPQPFSAKRRGGRGSRDTGMAKGNSFVFGPLW
jgi:hypothetical protein